MDWMREEGCGCGLLENGEVFVCPMHYGKMQENSYLNYGLVTDVETHQELSKEFSVPIVMCASTPLPHAKDHQCLLDGKEHDWYDATRFLKKCSKCGMSYEKPQCSGEFHFGS